MSETAYPNPFIKSRVDNPFQTHADLKTMYENEYNSILSFIPLIKSDPDFQSISVMVNGKPGSGKTHLAMRLTGDLINTNRIFYIRQPNNPESVLHFIYSKILESLSEKVNDSDFSQFSHFLAKSFSAILIKNKKKLSEDTDLLKELSEDSLNIYKKLGDKGTGTKKENWQTIKRIILDWWDEKYGQPGIGREILKAFIKFAAEDDPKKRQLIFRWINGSTLSMEEAETLDLTIHHTDIDHENFALEAITILSRLSIYDEPVVMIFDQLEGLDHSPALMINFFETIKEILTKAQNILFIFNIFQDKWEKWCKFLDPSIKERISQQIIKLEDSNLEKKKEILELRSREAGAPLDIFFTEDEVEKIADSSSIRGMLVTASHHFLNKTEGIPLPVRAETFEEKTEARLKELYHEINIIKKHLNINAKSSSEVINTREIELFLEEKKKDLKRKRILEPVYSETEDTGKLLTIAEAFMGTSILETGRLKTSRKKLPEHILFKGIEKSIAAGFLHMSGIALTTRLKNLSSMCENYPEIKFYLMRDKSASGIKAKGAQSLKDELSSRPNFRLFEIKDKDRLNFELVYELISAIRNLDLNEDQQNALSIAKNIIGENFIFTILEDAGVDI